MKKVILFTILWVCAIQAYCDVHITYYNDGAACTYNVTSYVMGKDGKPSTGAEYKKEVQHTTVKFEAKKRTIERPAGEPQTITIHGQVYIYGFETKNGLVLIYDGAEIEINNGIITIKKQGRSS